MAGLKPDAVVLVATVRALKYNGGVLKEELSAENMDALRRGIVNLEKHIENVQKYGGQNCSRAQYLQTDRRVRLPECSPASESDSAGSRPMRLLPPTICLRQCLTTTLCRETR